MTAFLTSLAQRAFGEAPVIRPVPRSRFEPDIDVAPSTAGIQEQAEAAESVAVRNHNWEDRVEPEPISIGQQRRLASSPAPPTGIQPGILANTADVMPIAVRNHNWDEGANTRRESEEPIEQYRPLVSPPLSPPRRVEPRRDGIADARPISQDSLDRPFQNVPPIMTIRSGHRIPPGDGNEAEVLADPILVETLSPVRRSQYSKADEGHVVMAARGMPQLPATEVAGGLNTDIPQTKSKPGRIPAAVSSSEYLAPDALPKSIRRAPQITKAESDLYVQPQATYEGVLVPPGGPAMFPPADRQPQTDNTPVVQVEIGRIDIRAARVPTSPTGARVKPAVMSLNEYTQRKRLS
jgi:hypothetical protein